MNGFWTRLPLPYEPYAFIAADPGESRVCYYIPGRLISAEAFQGEVSEVRVESWEGGSLLAFSLEKSPGEEEITEISIEFQYLGVLPRGQAALPGEASFLEWTEENLHRKNITDQQQLDLQTLLEDKISLLKEAF